MEFPSAKGVVGRNKVQATTSSSPIVKGTTFAIYGGHNLMYALSTCQDSVIAPDCSGYVTSFLL